MIVSTKLVLKQAIKRFVIPDLARVSYELSDVTPVKFLHAEESTRAGASVKRSILVPKRFSLPEVFLTEGRAKGSHTKYPIF